MHLSLNPFQSGTVDLIISIVQIEKLRPLLSNLLLGNHTSKCLNMTLAKYDIF